MSYGWKPQIVWRDCGVRWNAQELVGVPWTCEKTLDVADVGVKHLVFQLERRRNLFRLAKYRVHVIAAGVDDAKPLIVVEHQVEDLFAGLKAILANAIAVLHPDILAAIQPALREEVRGRLVDKLLFALKSKEQRHAVVDAGDNRLEIACGKAEAPSDIKYSLVQQLSEVKPAKLKHAEAPTRIR